MVTLYERRLLVALELSDIVIENAMRHRSSKDIRESKDTPSKI
jgi:hypothetical protein